MSNQITRNNYESFYIDYLDGNMSEKEIYAFECFLKNNPDLSINIEDIPSQFAPLNDIVLGENDKERLRIFDVSQKINSTNIENFLLAEIENILPPSKSKELALFLSSNEDYLVDFSILQKTIVKPDETIQYPEKQKLIRKEAIIPLWSKIGSIAAAITLIILYFLPSQHDTVKTKDNNPIQISQKTAPKTTLTSTKKELETKKIIINAPLTSPIDSVNAEIVNQTTQEIATSIKPTIDTLPIMPHPPIDNSYLSYSEMKQPIQPIVRNLLGKWKDKIDLRFSKATETKQGGMFIKIGEFEFSTKTSVVIASND